MNLKILIFIKILLLLNFFSIQANAKVVYLDLDFIIINSVAGKKLIKNLNDIKLNETKKFEKEFLNLKKVEEKTISQKKLITQEAYDIKVNNFKKKVDKFNKRRNVFFADFKKKKQLSIDNFIQEINPILSNYSKNDSITLIIHKKDIIMGKNELDITNKFLVIVDEKIKMVKIK